MNIFVFAVLCLVSIVMFVHCINRGFFGPAAAFALASIIAVIRIWG